MVWEVLANVRDQLVHDPAALSHEQIYDYIQHNVKDFVEFADSIEQKQA
ncbi:HepT-like ribonuclease domain-containing protein [Dictyobacter vulcani]